MFYVYFGHIILPAPDRLALVLLILQMKKFASIQRAIGGRTVTHTWPIWFHPLSSPPTLQMRAALVFSYPVILDVDSCPTLCSAHNRILAPTSGSQTATGEASLRRTTSVWPGPLSVLSGPAEDSWVSHTVLVPSCSSLRWLCPLYSDSFAQ